MFHLILDVDGTLVEEVVDQKEVPRLRPHLKEFLDYAFEHFVSVIVWTNAGSEWCNPILERIQEETKCREFRVVLTGDKRTSLNEVKNLKKIYKICPDMNKDNTLILDNTPATYRNNYGNAIGITTWFGNENDTQLLQVMANLERWFPEFIEKETVRKTNKYAMPWVRTDTESFVGV